MSVSHALLGAAIVAAGGTATFMGIRLFRQARASMTWPKTSGTIERLLVTETRVRDGFRAEPVVSYRYVVGDRTYRGSRIRFGSLGLNGSHAEAERALARFTKEGSVEIWYDPRDPNVAVIDRGTTEDVGPLIWGGVVAAVVGALIVWSSLT